MKIGKYISELLFEKDFVILPEFGEFTTKYIPARFVPELKKVEKPSKIIAFGDKRKTDDGVLSSFIAKKENIAPEKAKSFINSFVKEMNETLKSGKSVELEKVGKFSPGVGGIITFEPDKSINYLKDSFGMGSAREPEKKPAEAQKPPIAGKDVVKKDEPDKPKVGITPTEAKKEEPAKPKPGAPVTETKKSEPEKPGEKKDPLKDKDKAPETAAKKPDTPLKDKKPTPAPTTPVAGKPKEKPADEQEQPMLSPALKWIAFIAIPLLVIIIIFAFNFRYFVGTDTPDRESVGFFERIKSIFVEVEKPVTPTPEPIVTEELDEPDPAHVEPVETRPPHEPEPGRAVYHIVVGSFVEKHNAEIFVEDLRNKGATRASVFEQARTGHYRVSYGFYYSMQEAERELENIKQTVHPEAWILKR